MTSSHTRYHSDKPQKTVGTKCSWPIFRIRIFEHHPTLKQDALASRKKLLSVISRGARYRVSTKCGGHAGTARCDRVPQLRPPFPAGQQAVNCPISRPGPFRRRISPSGCSAVLVGSSRGQPRDSMNGDRLLMVMAGVRQIVACYLILRVRFRGIIASVSPLNTNGLIFKDVSIILLTKVVR